MSDLLTATRANSGQAMSTEQRVIIVTALVIGYAFIASWSSITDFFSPKPVPITVAELERQFDADTDGALAHWAGRPMLLSGKVKYRYGTELLLETINFAPVRAQMDSSASAEEGQPVVLHCRDIQKGGVFGDKPVPLHCNVVSSGAVTVKEI